MDPIFLRDVDDKPAPGAYADLIAACRRSATPFPQIWLLFAFKPEATKHLERFTHQVMRGPSPLSAGQRELIAAMTSGRNHCPF